MFKPVVKVVSGAPWHSVRPRNRELPLKPPDRIPIRATYTEDTTPGTSALDPGRRQPIRGEDEGDAARNSTVCFYLQPKRKELQINPGSGCLLVSVHVNRGGRGCVVVDFFFFLDQL